MLVFDKFLTEESAITIGDMGIAFVVIGLSEMTCFDHVASRDQHVTAW
jgi:hypothetical protein